MSISATPSSAGTWARSSTRIGVRSIRPCSACSDWSFGAGPYWEFGVLHLLNLLLFAASIVAFDYFLRTLRELATRWGRPELATISGTVTAYIIFGVLSLMMTPLSLPTPDLLLTTASFLTFGALLRLRDEPTRARHAVVLGLALAMGSLAKSFFIPWSAVVFLVAWAATRRIAGWRPTARVVAIWLLFVGPWCGVLSANRGHFTFGDTGRLTYVWFVNQIESPRDKVMPHGSATRASNDALVGVAVTPAARGTNPVWFDPARWYTGISPKWNFTQQVTTFSQEFVQFFASFSPLLLVVCFALVVATREARRLWWARMWIIVLPALAAMGAYSLVLVTTRYIAPFVVMLIVGVWFTLRWPSRLTPARVVIGLAVPLAIVLAAPSVGPVLSFLDAALVAVIIAWVARRRGPRAMVVAGVFGAMATYILMPPSPRSFVMIGTVLIVASYWIASRHAIRKHEARRFSDIVRRGVVITNGLIIGYVALLKYSGSVTSPPMVAGEANMNWMAAQQAQKAGIEPGARIAIVGSPFEAYWARTGRLQIVGVVPPWRVAAFQALPADKRDALFREFARAGATAIVSQTRASPVQGDSTWMPVAYVGWIKRLPGR